MSEKPGKKGAPVKSLENDPRFKWLQAYRSAEGFPIRVKSFGWYIGGFI
jgi:hypothetical protein